MGASFTEKNQQTHHNRKKEKRKDCKREVFFTGNMWQFHNKREEKSREAIGDLNKPKKREVVGYNL